jgi:hypothetical protein
VAAVYAVHQFFTLMSPEVLIGDVLSVITSYLVPDQYNTLQIVGINNGSPNPPNSSSVIIEPNNGIFRYRSDYHDGGAPPPRANVVARIPQERIDNLQKAKEFSKM